MIVPHEFTIRVKPASIGENSLPILTWTFHYRGKMYGNALELPAHVFEDKDNLKFGLDLLITNLMASYEAVVREGTGEEFTSSGPLGDGDYYPSKEKIMRDNAAR